jgi:hypothetical protein
MMGRPVTDCLDEANQKILKEQMARRRKGEREPYELVWTGKDGGKIPTIMSPEPIFDSERHFKGSFAVVMDISELRQVEQALGESEEQLESKTHSLEEIDAALKGLLKRMDEDKTALDEKVLVKMKQLVAPYLQRLKATPLDDKQMAHISLIESNINNIKI